MELAEYTTDFELYPSPMDEKAINAIWDKFEHEPVEIASNATMKLDDIITTKLFGTRQNDKEVWVVEKTSNHRYCVWVYDDKSEAASEYIGCIDKDLYLWYKQPFMRNRKIENKQYTVKEFNKRIKRIADTIDAFGTPIDEHMKAYRGWTLRTFEDGVDIMYQGAFVVSVNTMYEQRDIDSFPETVVPFMAAPEPKPWFEETDDAKIFDDLMVLVGGRAPSDGWLISKIPTFLDQFSSQTEVIKSIEGNFKVVKTKVTEGDTILEQTVRFFGITPNQLRTVIKQEQENKIKFEKEQQATAADVVERMILTRPDGVVLEQNPDGWHLHCGNNTVAYYAKTRSVSVVWGSLDNFLHMVKNK